MFSFNDGIAGDMTFRLMPAAASPDSNSSEDVPMDRELPSKNVTAETLTDTYVSFILYCNPQFPLTVQTSQLVEKFNSVPRTDSKEFQTWRLFELIKKFDAREIETWLQLALDLGVEPPDISKQQSIQKVQQYTVRLKRWMRAMHIDAFFEWLLGKEHIYVNNIPPVEDPYPAAGRDGVPTEEDLAIRALEPSFRPKRGRRRNSEIEADEEERRNLPLPFDRTPVSAHPQRGPWGGVSMMAPQGYGDWQAPHSAINPPAHIRWGTDIHGDVLSSPHPMSAMPGGPPRSFDDAYAGEPMSAITPSSSKKRKKHGPAVSSAWASSTSAGSRPRGRPPASKTTNQEGPFGTFPVQPSIEAQRTTSPFAMAPSDSSEAAMPPPLSSTPVTGSGRPGRLSLTVPQHTGPPVRLATPPRLAVNNEASRATSEIETSEPAMLSYETMKRTLASDLLRADMVGRPQRLSGDEAKRLADAILERLKVSRADEPDFKTNLARLTAASWLGLGDQLNIPAGPALGLQKKIRVTRFRVDNEGYEEIVPANEESGDSGRTCQGNFELTGISLATVASPTKRVDDIHDLIISRVLADAKEVGLSADVEYTATRAPRSYDKYGPQMNREAGTIGNDDEIDWKARAKMLEFGASLAHGEFDRYRATMVQKVLDIFLEK
ncbi:hypothetical protein AMS68_007622 [Peltaster fructicola]|uniref:Uncharacterized protein n=1 Tax=Peltaster fructicola TaxID=286661 RepID=A0A6H0Y5C5_9PEZI|nr:hypothetical protein AMS68_007622 [Peltaster fructicola]